MGSFATGRRSVLWFSRVSILGEICSKLKHSKCFIFVILVCKSIGGYFWYIYINDLQKNAKYADGKHNDDSFGKKPNMNRINSFPGAISFSKYQAFLLLWDALNNDDIQKVISNASVAHPAVKSPLTNIDMRRKNFLFILKCI